MALYVSAVVQWHRPVHYEGQEGRLERLRDITTESRGEEQAKKIVSVKPGPRAGGCDDIDMRKDEAGG